MIDFYSNVIEPSLLVNSFPLLQIIVALVLGMLLGVERSFEGKMAGMRTYALVSMGSCLLVITSNLVNQSSVAMGLVNVDPTRLAAGIIAGIGFVGLGITVFRDMRVNGLTTVTGLWIAAAIGIAIGFGFFMIAIFTSLLTVFTFTILRFFENKVRDMSHQENNNQ